MGGTVTRLAMTLAVMAVAALPTLSDASGYCGSCYVAYSYPTYSYAAPVYNYRYEPAGYAYGKYFPAGYYAWVNGAYYLQGYGRFDGYDASYTPPPAAPTYRPFNWKDGIIKYAEARDDQVAFQQALKAAGINGQQYFSGTANIFGNGYLNQAVLGSYGTSGQTLFGNTYQQVAALYGTTDVNALNQAAWRSVEQAQTYTRDAHAGTLGINQIVNAGAAEIAKVAAGSQAGANLLRAAAQPSSQVATTVTTNGTMSGGTGASALPRAGAALQGQAGGMSDQDFMERIVKAECFSCHSGSNKLGNLDLAGYLTFNGEQKLKVIKRVLSTDLKKVMPRKEPAGDGTPLPESSQWEFTLH